VLVLKRESSTRCTVRVHELFKLKQNVLGVPDSEFRLSKSLKDHFNCCHYCIQCKTLGTTKYTDCMAFEHKHLFEHKHSEEEDVADEDMLNASGSIYMFFAASCTIFNYSLT
jgi:hypothetical protein